MMTTLAGRTDLSLVKGPSSTVVPKHLSPRSVGVVSSGSNAEITLPDIRTKDGIVDKQKPLPTSLQQDFIPDDILAALTYPPQRNEKLGPPTRYRNLNTTTTQQNKAPASVWNFPKRREKLKHLTQNTPCVCGAGKDISFLYDVPKEEKKDVPPGLFDKSAVRVEKDEEVEPTRKAITLPDTLIPEEYHIVKNKGVMGLEYHEEQFSTQAGEHEKHLVQFPSLNPTSRYEVLQLQKVLDEMLDRIGINDLDVELKGPTQMHNLLELIKKEQNIYNIVFHELIRQVSIECLERGELLANLRDNYSALLNKVPRQIKGLHEEVLAQRALDRRLTEELMRFKSTISALTSELTSVKEHDNEVTRQANKAQDELKAALAESRKNASLLTEYHDLYELQRKRLEKSVEMLSDEKEIWSTAAYSLALKVMEEHSLNTAKRLHVSEKSWSKLANHFTILLSDKDTEVLAKMQGFVDKWRTQVEDFDDNTKEREAEMLSQLQSVSQGMQSWIRDFEKNYLSKDGHLSKQPDKSRISQLYADIRQWEDTMSQESEKFGGDTVLTGQEFIANIRLQMYGWTDCAMKLFGRHQQGEGKQHPDHTDMLKLNEEIQQMLGQYSVRLTGENGVANGVIHISNMLESWSAKINTVLHGSNPLPDQDWIRFYQLLDDWSNSMDYIISLVGSTQREDLDTTKVAHRHIELSDVMRMTQKWLSSTTNGMDSEDAKLVEAVGALHTEKVKWMVQMLLRLAPDRPDHSDEAKEAVLLGSASVAQLQASAKSLFLRLADFTEYVTNCCKTIVAEDMQLKVDLRAENADQEYNALKKLGDECAEWIAVAKIMLDDLTGREVVTEVAPATDTNTSAGEVKAGKDASGQDEAKTTQDNDPTTTVEQTQVSDAEKGDEGATTADSDEKLSDTKTSDPSADGQKESEESQMEEAEETTNQTIETSTTESMDNTTSPTEESVSKAEPEPESVALPDEQLEVIGFDANTYKKLLEQDPDAAPPHSETIKPKERPETPNTKKAYEALAAMESLQEQLLTTEERAQQAEDRATWAEAHLKAAKEKIRALQRELGLPEETPKPEASEPSPNEPTADTTETEQQGSDETAEAPTKDKSKEKLSRSSSKSSGKAKKK